MNNDETNKNIEVEIKSIDSKLNLIKYTTLRADDHAWMAGYYAAQTDLELENNPFDSLDIEYKQWEAGWWDGFYGEDYSAVILSEYLGKHVEIKNPTASISSSKIFQANKWSIVDYIEKSAQYIQENYRNILILASILAVSFVGFAELVLD